MRTTGRTHLGWPSTALAALSLVGVGQPDLANAGPSPSQTSAGDWPMAARDYANTRFSPLTEISPANVATLRMAFTFSTGVLRGHEAAPIVIGPTMFIATKSGNGAARHSRIPRR